MRNLRARVRTARRKDELGQKDDVHSNLWSEMGIFIKQAVRGET